MGIIFELTLHALGTEISWSGVWLHMLLSKPEITSMFRGVARLWCANKDRLSEIDSRFGDGDHGVTIGKIAGLITKNLDAWEDDDIEEFLQSLGDDTMEIGGGSAGPLYGR